jgi:hypothetical protein
MIRRSARPANHSALPAVGLAVQLGARSWPMERLTTAIAHRGGGQPAIDRPSGRVPSSDLARARVRVVVTRVLKGATDVSSAVRVASEEVGNLVPNARAWIVLKHPKGNRNHHVLTGTTRALLATIAGQRVQGPHPHLVVRVRQIRNELGNGRFV